MDLGFNEQQKMLKSTARDFLENESPTSTVRELEKSTAGYSSEHWGKMADLGWLGLGFSSAYGGSDGDLIDQTALFEEIGRAILPGPTFISTVLCSQILLNAANEDQKQRLLPQIAHPDNIWMNQLMRFVDLPLQILKALGIHASLIGN